jgi:anaerobic selenocysteine-containing dehydrogenase
VPEHKATFCRICEPLCGMMATVEDGRLVALRPDPDHPLSTGFACQKGIAFTEVQNDPDRVTTPLKRTGPNPLRASGSSPVGFVPVSWEEAMSDIAARLGRIHRRHGAGAIGWYFGNPGGFSYSHMLWVPMFMVSLNRPWVASLLPAVHKPRVASLSPASGRCPQPRGRTRSHLFTAGSQDINNRFVASQLLYGSPLAVPVPDVLRTDFPVVIGANPLVSHGSALTVPRVRDRMHDIVKRGGRVLVVDPRKTETAERFEWLGIVPDGDAFLLLSLLQVMFAENLADRVGAASPADGLAWLELLAAPFTPEVTQAHTGIAPDVVRALARDLARTARAAVYGRVGTSIGENGTLTTYLRDAVNLVAGNLDVAGGSMFGALGLPFERRLTAVGAAVLRRIYQRRRSRIGGFPSVLLSEPAGVMAKEITTDGDGQIKALLVSAGNPVLSVPNGDELEAALGELELMVGIDLYVNETTAHCDYILPAATMYERDDFVVPAAASSSRDGQPEPYLRPGMLRDIVVYRDRRVHLRHPGIETEVAALSGRTTAPADFPLRLIGMRELRSENSWMHNAPLLMRGQRQQRALMHVDDADAIGVNDGDLVRVTSAHGQIELPVALTKDLVAGVVAIPHGWGHRGTGGWRVANRAGGANVNRLMSSDPADLEALAGMARLTGVPVRVETLDSGTSEETFTELRTSNSV